MSKKDSTCVRSVAPEDLCVGDVVAVLRQVREVLAWSCPVTTDQIVVHRVAVMPDPWDAGQPLKVRRICLPFVYARDAEGTGHTLDVRGCELARVSRAYWEAIREDVRKTKAGTTPR